MKVSLVCEMNTRTCFMSYVTSLLQWGDRLGVIHDTNHHVVPKVCNCRQYCLDLIRSHQCSTAYTSLVPLVNILKLPRAVVVSSQ